tara:strand:+ start:454 stop:855 length:402 start_codon:yes stop_codon:yes gene_type:complete
MKERQLSVSIRRYVYEFCHGNICFGAHKNKYLGCMIQLNYYRKRYIEKEQRKRKFKKEQQKRKGGNEINDNEININCIELIHYILKENFYKKHLYYPKSKHYSSSRHIYNNNNNVINQNMINNIINRINFNLQ